MNEQKLCAQLYILGFPNMKTWTKHDFIITEVDDNRGWGSIYDCKKCKKQITCINSAMMSSTLTNDFEMDCSKGELIYSVPELEELIKECGLPFYLGCNTKDYWYAKQGFNSESLGDAGVNPKEAVMRFWIKKEHGIMPTDK